MKTLVKKKLTQLFSIVKKVLPKEISHKRSALFLFSLVVFGGIALYAEPIYAQDLLTNVGEQIGLWITQAFMGMSEFFIKMAIFFLQYFIAIAQFNNYLDVATVMLGWTMVRDVANMFFVVILLAIAFGTILGVEQYQWNKTLVKLILAAVFINFSNLICGIFIDAAHVFTITFVNAVSATAGGNFIQAFKLQELNKIAGDPNAIDGATKFGIRLFVGALASLLFAITAMCIIAVYAIIMLARMVALWVLVIFSPLAFILQVLPGTQSYAKQWWDKFMKQVLVAPVMVFFLWLTFATAGSGGIANEIGIQENLLAKQESGGVFQTEEGAGPNTTASSLNSATTWANMASFFIPLALMVVGMNVVQQMGVVGGGLVQSGQAMAKKIAGYATGYNAARWTAGKAKDLGTKGIKAAAWHMPVVGGASLTTFGKQVAANVKGAWYRRATGLTDKSLLATQRLAEKRSDLEKTDRELESKDLTDEARSKKEQEKKVLESEIDEEEAIIKSEAQKGGIIGFMAKRGVSRRKHLGKSEKEAELLENIAFARMQSETGGAFFNKVGEAKSRDRLLAGVLEGEKARKAAKDEEYIPMGKMGVLGERRIKYGTWGSLQWEEQGKAGTMQDQIASHRRRGQPIKDTIENLEKAADIRINEATAAQMKIMIEQEDADARSLDTPKHLEHLDAVTDAEKKANEEVAKLEDWEKNLPKNIAEAFKRLKEGDYGGEKTAAARKALEDYYASPEGQAEDVKIGSALETLFSGKDFLDADAAVNKQKRTVDEKRDEYEKTKDTVDDLRDKMKEEEDKETKDQDPAKIAEIEGKLLKAEAELKPLEANEAELRRLEARRDAKVANEIEDAKSSKRKGLEDAVEAAESEDKVADERDNDIRDLETVAATNPAFAKALAEVRMVKDKTEMSDGSGRNRKEGEKRAEVARILDNYRGSKEYEEKVTKAGEDKVLAKSIKDKELEKDRLERGLGIFLDDRKAGKDQEDDILKEVNTARAKVDKTEGRIARLTNEGKDTRSAETQLAKDKAKLDAANAKLATHQKTTNDELEKRSKEIKDVSKEIEDLRAKTNSTDTERGLNTFLGAETRRRQESDEVKTHQKTVEEADEKKAEALELAREPLQKAREDLQEYEQKDEYKKHKESAGYKTAKEAVDARSKARQEEIMSGRGPEAAGLKAAFVAQQKELMDEALKATQAQMEGVAVRIGSIGEMFGRAQQEELLSQAGQKLKENVKKSKLAEIFKKGAKDLEKAAKEFSKNRNMAAAYADIGAGAQALRAEVANNYAADLETTQRKRTEDIADGQYSLDRFGFDTPHGAFKNLIKKRMDETFTGVEREQAVVMAMGSLSKMINAKQTGDDLDIDHEAQMMANVNYLTKQAWSDDMLAAIVNKINNRNSLTGADREEAESLKEIFVDRLQWGKDDGKRVRLIDRNQSSNKRTNDLHRLSAYAGDVDLLQSENAVLKFQKRQADSGVKMGYLEAAKEFANQVTEAIKGQDFSAMDSTDKQRLAASLGVTDSLGIKEIEAFSKKFAKAETSAADAFKNFENEIRKFGEANELMADFKNMAMAVGHLDDGGHTYFDMKDKMARGFLAEDSMDFMLSDWRKLSDMERMSRLKSHSVGQMDEESGVLYMDRRNRGSINETFQGVSDNSRNWEKVDGRVKDHLAGAAAGEKFKIDEKTGRSIILSSDSAFVAKTFRGADGRLLSAVERQKAATQQLANNWATMMASGRADIAAAAIGSKTGVKFDDAVKGNFKFIIGEGRDAVSIESEKQWIDWVMNNATDDIKTEINRKSVENTFASHRTREQEKKPKK